MVAVLDAEASLTSLRLDNGLRVQLCHQEDAAAVAVSVHYGVGHRHERPGEEGLAHLLEHLVTQDAPGAVTSVKLAETQALGGVGGATTHQDYTDFFQAVPAAALEAVLHWEADRMRAPRFTRAHLDRQLAGVGEEIASALHRRPYGGLPWPRLPEVLFSSFANRHNGFGDIRRLAKLTVERCHDFFERHYGPENAVLTVVGDLTRTSEPIEQLIARHFATLPARPAPAQPCLDEPVLDRQLVRDVDVPGDGPPVAVVGYRLPDAASDLDGYLAHVVLAALLPGYARQQERRCADAGTSPIRAASCGFFDLLDARDPDALVLTCGPVRDDDPRLAAALLDHCLDEVADGQDDGAITRAALRIATERARQLANPLARCRQLGRSALLFGTAALATELPARLCRLDAGDVAEAAARLRSLGRVVLLARPRGSDPSPQSPLTPRPDGATGEPPNGASAFRALPRPPLAGQPRYTRLLDRILRGGHRVAVIEHPGTSLVEVRVRLRPVQQDPDLAAACASHLAATLASDHLAIRPVTTSRAGAVEVSCAVAPPALDAWLRHLRAALDAPAAGEHLARRPAALTPEELADRVSQRRHLGLPDAGPVLPPDPAVVLAGGAVELVLVGRIDPACGVDLVAETLAGLQAVAAPGSPVGARPTGLEPVAAPGRRLAAVLRAPAPAGTPDAAQHLLVALLSGVGSVASGGRARLGTLGGSGLFVGRDVLAGATSFFLRGSWPVTEATQALWRLHDEVLVPSEPVPTGDELEQVRTFCIGQWLTGSDDAAQFADTVLQQLAYGRAPADVPALVADLRGTSPRDVAAAWERFRDGPPLTGAIVGPTDELSGEPPPWPLTWT